MRSAIAFVPALSLLALQACYEWTPAGGSVTQAVAAREGDPGSTIRITRQNGSVQTVRGARIEGDSLLAFPSTSSTLQLAPIAVRDIQSVDVRHMQKVKTIVAGSAFALGVLLLVGLVTTAFALGAIAAQY